MTAVHGAPLRDLQRQATAFAADDGLTAHRSAFDRRDVIRAVAERTADGATPAEVRAAATAIMADPLFAPTGGHSGHGGPIYSTVALMAIERDLVAVTGRSLHARAAVSGNAWSATGGRPATRFGQSRSS